MVYSRKKKSESKEKVEKPENAAQALPVAASNSDDLTDRLLPYEIAFAEVDDYALMLLDLDGSIRTWNNGAAGIYGYPANEATGRHYRILFTGEDRQAKVADKLLDDAHKQRKAGFEGWLLRKDGKRFWATVSITALHNAEGKLKGYLKITRDLTDKKMADDNDSNFVEELKLRNEALTVSEERYHKMVAEVIDYAIILMDKNGRILDWNKGAEKVKGYSAAEIIGKSFRMFYPREEKESRLPERLLAEAVAKGRVTHEGWRIRKDGSRFWGNITITALHNEAGDVIGFSKVTRDLTDMKIAEDRISNVLEELRQANEKLRQNEERYHRMIAEVKDYAIILLDPAGNIQNWNAGAEMIKGYKSDEIVGKNFRIFYPKEDKNNGVPETLLAKAVAEGKATHEGWRVRKDGSRFWGSIVITALHDSNGKVIGFSKLTRDLTERKNAEDALRKNAAQLDLKNKTLERLNEELSSFSYIASHDMKEPLRKIQTFVSRIEDYDYNPEKTKEFLGKISNSASRMQQLIEDLLSYSQVSNGQDKIQRVDLGKVLQQVLSDLEIAISEKGAEVVCDHLPVVPGVSHQLHQLFQNLLSNSLKFAREDRAPRISIRTERIKGPEIPGDGGDTNQYYHVTISDNGIGFSAQDNHRIFEAFQRLNPKGKFEGSGIGLAIVKKIVDNHQGVITAESAPGAGATFHLYLPVR